MNRECWLDGFNFFHCWEHTRGYLRADSGMDIVRAIERSLRILGRQLGGKCRHTIVYLDGGLSRHETRIATLRVRYAGPGRKADDRMADDLGELGDAAGAVTAVSNDRELKGRLRNLGASCLGVSEYLAALDGKKGAGRPAPGKKGGQGGKARGRPGNDEEIMRQKCRTLSPFEVDAWLEYFGEEGGDGDETEP